MKKFEIPEINISMFDNAVATDGSATAQAIADLEGTATSGTKAVSWTDDSAWTVTF
jgi:hypothetical protein